MGDTDTITAEIGHLLDQCSPEELQSILDEIEGKNPPKDDRMPVNIDGAEVLCLESKPGTGVAPTDFSPVPPSAPRPDSGGRRPVPANMKPATPLTMSQMKALLEQHSNSMLEEVRRMIPEEKAPKASAVNAASGLSNNDAVDLDTLTKILVERDREALRLEARLAELQAVLVEKDKYVVDLGEELDQACREVRHRKLDLEFQQLKLEERVRTNAELEQAQRMLTLRKEEASQNAKHAAIDVEACRNSPRGVRLQGTLPYALRKGGMA